LYRLSPSTRLDKPYLGLLFVLILTRSQITKIAQARRVTPQKLFAPFWRSLALKVVKDVKERPYITHTIADLLQIPAQDLLKQVQSHALPWLVLQGKKDVIQKIAEARGEADLHSVILDPANIGPILGFLMMQTIDKVDDFALSKLTAISNHFDDEPISELLRSALAGAALEIFKMAAEGDDTRKQMARNTLTEIARMVGNPRESRSKKGNIIGKFLEPHVLGLLTQVNDVISMVTFGRPATLEHRLYLQAVEEMIRVCKSHARVARPQVRC
jgi:serine/threonine-protein kinase ATR